MDNIFDKFSPNLRQVLMMSERVSAEQNSKIDTEHQLLALILFKGTLANDVLTMFDISIDRAQLVASLVRPKKDGSNGVKENAKAAIQLAVQFAMKYRHDQVDCEHLLMALISNKTFNSSNIIERMGVSPIEIKKQLESIFSEASKTPANDNFSAEANEDQEDEDFPAGEPMGFSFPGEAPVRLKKNKSSLKEFTINISELAKQGKIDPVIGRQDEIDRMIQILIRRKKNNPVLIGEPGVGKTAIVEGLALRIHQGDVPAVIANKEIYTLDLPSLLAGTMYRGQFETRIKKLLEDIQKNKNAILFIDELHTVIGAGSAEGSLDAANILKPKLARGEIRVIGATTLDEYKKHIEKDAAFERRFQPVMVNEPSIEETIQILRGIAKEYEKHHHVVYTNDALEAAARLSSRYIQDRYLPDKAIDLIDEAAAAHKMTVKEPAQISKLSSELQETIKQKDEAVASERYEKATFLRQKELALKNKIEKLSAASSHTSYPVIDDESIAKVVSKWTSIPTTSLRVSDKKRFLNMEKRLESHIVGQSDAIRAIATSIRRSRMGVANPNRPIGSFLFLGPTGVGKTELVKVLAREVFGSDRSLIKIDMSEFMEKHNVSRLVGAPAGYVGYDEGGQLTERVRRNPYSIILLDELEKAHPEVFNLLLQILEDGELTDAKGRRVDFRNTMIIATSNLGTDKLHSQAHIGFEAGADAGSMEYDKLQEKVSSAIEHHFRPEFLNRIDQIVVFRPLDEKAIKKIAVLEFNKLRDRLKSQNISLSANKAAIKWIAEHGFDPSFGARPMRRIIADHIESPVSEMLLKDEIVSGDRVTLNVNQDQINIVKE